MPEKNSLPEWLIADGDDRDFVIHLHWPRFVMEFVEDAGSVVLAIDPDSEVIELELAAGREPAVLMSRLMREAGEFFMEQMNHDDEY